MSDLGGVHRWEIVLLWWRWWIHDERLTISTKAGGIDSEFIEGVDEYIEGVLRWFCGRFLRKLTR